MRSIGWAVGVGCLIASASIAQNVVPQETSTAASAHIAALDAALGAKDYLALGPMIGNPPDQATMMVNLDWLRDRMTGGTTSFVGLLYARTLWALAAQIPEPTRTGLRETAVLATLYTYSAITVDGQRCADRTAPTHRIEQLFAVDPGLIAFYRAMPADRKALTVDAALMIERKTAVKRDAEGDVAFVCFGGLDEIQYNMANGSSREVPIKPGEIGRHIEVTGDGHYQPKQIALADRTPKMAAARASLPTVLASLGGD